MLTGGHPMVAPITVVPISPGTCQSTDSAPTRIRLACSRSFRKSSVKASVSSLLRMDRLSKGASTILRRSLPRITSLLGVRFCRTTIASSDFAPLKRGSKRLLLAETTSSALASSPVATPPRNQIPSSIDCHLAINDAGHPSASAARTSPGSRGLPVLFFRTNSDGMWNGRPAFQSQPKSRGPLASA